MLGDPNAFVESPGFAARRLQLLHARSTADAYRRALCRLFFPSNSVGRRRGRYAKFARVVGSISAADELRVLVAKVVEEEEADGGEEARGDGTSRLPRSQSKLLRKLEAIAAAGGEAASSQLARSLVDFSLRGRESVLLHELLERADVTSEGASDAEVLRSSVSELVRPRAGEHEGRGLDGLRQVGTGGEGSGEE